MHEAGCENRAVSSGGESIRWWNLSESEFISLSLNIRYLPTPGKSPLNTLSKCMECDRRFQLYSFSVALQGWLPSELSFFEVARST